MSTPAVVAAAADGESAARPTASSHTPTASSPSAVLQLSYEAASSADATAAPAPSHDAPSGLSAEQQASFDQLLHAQGECGVRPFFLAKFETDSVRNWDKFYRRNADRFYRDRHYLTQEFHELRETMAQERRDRGEQVEQEEADGAPDAGDVDDGEGASPPASSPSAAAPPMQPIREPTAAPLPGQRTLLEVGCGVGNALFPLLRLHPSLFLYGVDCSKNAIQCVQNHADYEPQQSKAEEAAAAEGAAATSSSSVGGRCAAWVVDLVTDPLPPAILSGADGQGVDFATLIFILSAIHPSKMPLLLAKVRAALKDDGGVLFLRDYCQYDLAQLRFAKTSKLGPSWYVRQDGTRSYFFTLEELQRLVREAGFEVIEAAIVCKKVVNRKEGSEMSRRFVQIRARAVGTKETGDKASGSGSGSADATHVAAAANSDAPPTAVSQSSASAIA